jgi:hypothetical protein
MKEKVYTNQQAGIVPQQEASLGNYHHIVKLHLVDDEAQLRALSILADVVGQASLFITSNGVGQASRTETRKGISTLTR